MGLPDSPRKEEEYDKGLRKEVDSLLATSGDSTSNSEIGILRTSSPQLQTSNFPRSSSPIIDGGAEVQPKGYKILSLLTLVVSSTLGAAVQPNAVLQNQTFVLGLIPLHFGILGGVIHYLDRDKHSEGELKLEVGSGGAKEISSSGRIMEVLSNPEAFLLILTSVAVVHLDILQGRYVQGETWQALEVSRAAAIRFGRGERRSEILYTHNLKRRYIKFHSLFFCIPLSTGAHRSGPNRC